MNSSMKELCVVHLVRAHNGIEPFRRFLDSYRANPEGIDHDLLIVFKGFRQPRDTAQYRDLLKPFRYIVIEISDEGVDITAYWTAFNRYSEQYRYFCFLNSYSVILDSNWLGKLYENISKPGVGLAGATGSWNSHRTSTFIWFRDFLDLGASGILNRINRDNQIMETGKHQHKARSYSKLAIYIVKDLWNKLLLIIYYGSFPNYHIRTNAFIISGELMKTLKCPPMKTKKDAYRFESGMKGLTRQIIEMGKRVIVVGKDGIGYEKETWCESKTFWQSEQENLLVADNQTRDYQEGSPERRIYLSSIAWGANNRGGYGGQKRH